MHLLLTGATGFVGKAVLDELLANGHEVTCVIRATHNRSSVERWGDLRFSGIQAMSLRRVRCFHGDLEDLDTMAHMHAHIGTVDGLVHCAGSVQFNDWHQCYKNNVIGAEHVMNVVRKMEIPSLFYMSTAYVCGKGRSKYEAVKEEWYTPFEEPEFNNPYERSKYLAEHNVRNFCAQAGVVCTVFRPTIVVGKASTGETTCYNGFYQLLRSTYKLHQFHKAGIVGNDKITLGLLGTEPVNLVPVDYVADVVARVVNTPHLRGHIYHLTPSVPLNAAAVTGRVLEYFVVHKLALPEVCLTRPQGHRLTMAERTLHGWMGPYVNYWGTDPVFDTRNTQLAMEGKYVLSYEALERIIDFAIKTNFGRKPCSVA